MASLAASLLVSFTALGSVAQGAVIAERAAAVKKLPFTRVVAFGDNLSDNGNGSVAHCVAQTGDCKNSIYGYNTWTNGPVAVSYLSGLLNVPLLDYAYGHAAGGSLFGATIDNAYTQSTAKAPSSKDQIANYTANTRGAVDSSLHFLWIGANDINLYHIYTWFAENHVFGDQFAPMLAAQVQTLINQGAMHIFVPNLYPKHISPSVLFYASKSQAEVDSLSAAIVYANQQIQAALAKLQTRYPRRKIIYYDVYGKILSLLQNKAALGFTHVTPEFCDGYSQLDWDLCVTRGQGNTFMWMQYLDPTTRVHNLIAQDMYNTIKATYGVQ